MERRELGERCYAVGLRTVRLSKDLPTDSIFKIISNQLIRSATSVGANYFEARAASSRREFKRFLEISLRSTNETVYWIRLLTDCDLKDNEPWQKLKEECCEVAKMLAAAVIKLKI